MYCQSSWIVWISLITAVMILQEFPSLIALKLKHEKQLDALRICKHGLGMNLLFKERWEWDIRAGRVMVLPPLLIPIRFGDVMISSLLFITELLRTIES